MKNVPVTKFKKRRERGFSLIYVLSVGSIASLMAFAILSPLLPVYRHVARQDNSSRVSTIAETGMQYAIARINNAAENDTLDELTFPILVPPDLVSGESVSIDMQKIDGSSVNLANSPIYNSLNEWKDLPTGARPPEDYRALEVTFSKGGLKTNIKAIIGPDYISMQNPNTSYFQNALFGQSSMTLGNGVTVSSASFDRSTPIIATKGTFTSTNSTLDGSLSADTLNINRNTIINGDLYYNSSSSTDANSFKTDDPADSKAGTPNVYGDQALGSNPALTPNPNPFGQISTNTAQSNVAPAPTVEATSPAQIQETGTNVFTVTAPPSGTIQNLGSISLGTDPSNPTQTLVIPPGTYTVQSIEISGTSSIELASSIPGQSVNLYVQGTTSDGTALNLAGNGTKNTGSSNNLQIFYNGSQNTNVSSSFKGLVYAPNSDINFTMNSSGSYSGAITGNKVTVTGNGTFNYDPGTTSTAGGGPGYVKPDQNSVPKRFNILSWKENSN